MGLLSQFRLIQFHDIPIILKDFMDFWYSQLFPSHASIIAYNDLHFLNCDFQYHIYNLHINHLMFELGHRQNPPSFNSVHLLKVIFLKLTHYFNLNMELSAS